MPAPNVAYDTGSFQHIGRFGLGIYKKSRHRFRNVANHTAQCDAVVSHARAQCQWSRPRAERDTRMIHFNGKKKQWARAVGACRLLRLGSLQLGPALPQNGTTLAVEETRELGGDDIAALHEYALEWSDEHQACLSWAEANGWCCGPPMRVRRCCTLIGAMPARWYSSALGHRVEQV